MDHTKADIFVVDEETRQPLGRPWLTLAMDVCSRMVTGFYLTMEAPSRLSTSLCLLHSVFDKSAWLREREIAEPWPIAGLPDTVHVDNGADFRSRAFKRGCQDAAASRSSGGRQVSRALAVTSSGLLEHKWEGCTCYPGQHSATNRSWESTTQSGTRH
ncbi:transposase family protein [Hoeflea alexandrii]|nr:transposase family protein [Hoeflea alexandrii]MCY0150929.1 transposase family protein [Hoeflea alexandrii]